MSWWKARNPWWNERDPKVARRVLLIRLERLIRRDSPRLLMFTVVSATAVAGLFASVILREVGLLRMSLRYGLSVGIAYVAFMFFIWLWLQRKRRARVEAAGWDDDNVDVHVATDSAQLDSGDGVSVGGGGDLDLDIEGLVWIAVIAAISSAIVASGYVVFIAPELLAELLLDGVLATALYRRLGRLDRRHWLESAISRTWVSVAIVATLFVIAGAVCGWYAPEASTLGGVWRHWRAR